MAASKYTQMIVDFIVDTKYEDIPEKAIENAITVEVTAETTFIARIIGKPQYLTEDETRRAWDFCNTCVGQPKEK